jgi:hypothetical protein
VNIQPFTNRPRQIADSFGLSEPPDLTRVPVRTTGTFFPKPNQQDLEDQNRAYHLRNLIHLAAAAQVGAAHVSTVGYQATVLGSQAMEDTLKTYSPESRTGRIAEALFEPVVQQLAEGSLAISQATTRAILSTLGR